MPDLPADGSQAEGASDDGDSLDRDLTQAHSLGDAGGPDAGAQQGDSLDRGQTLGRSGSSSSDISQFDEGWEQTEQAKGLDTRYAIEGPIGHGGMGEVFRARDTRLKRSVAIKRLRGDLSRNRRAVERFSREAEAVARLNHYNIVQIHDVGQDQSGNYIVMELVEGDSLSDRLKSSGALNPSKAIELTGQLCDALTYAHQQGIVHRDIKPANILLAEGDVPKLTDFGLARLEGGDHAQTRAGAVLGTIDFMPPEQHQDASRADARSDQWALAATFYQMVTGESPRVIRPDRLPESTREAVLQALEENPEKRFEDCRAFRDALVASNSKPVETSIAPVTLTRGECSQCSHVNTDNMAFCEACGASLTVPCPSCNESIGVWSTFCGKCGTDTKEFLDSQLSELVHQRQEIDSMRRGYRHADAIVQLEEISRLEHPALEEHQAWAAKMILEYRAEFADLEKQREDILKLVNERMSAHDVEGAMQLLDRIPAPLSNPRIDALRNQVSTRVEQIKTLGKEIRSAVSSKKFEGLIPKLEEFLLLRPADNKARKLLSQLEKRQAKQDALALQAATSPDSNPPDSNPPGSDSLGSDSLDSDSLGATTVAAGSAVLPHRDGELGSSFLDAQPDSNPAPRPVNANKNRQRRKRRTLQIVGVGLMTLFLLVLAGMQWIGDPPTSNNPVVESSALAANSESSTLTSPGPTPPAQTTDQTETERPSPANETGESQPTNTATRTAGDPPEPTPPEPTTTTTEPTTTNSGSNSTVQTIAGDWEPLFKGVDLTGWTVGFNRSNQQQGEHRWSVDRDSGIIRTEGGEHDFLISDESLENYTLDLKWRFPNGAEKGNGSGIILHSDGTLAERNPKGIEIDLFSMPSQEMEMLRQQTRLEGKPGMFGTGCLITYAFKAANYSGDVDGIIGEGHKRNLDRMAVPNLNALTAWNRLTVTAVRDRLVVRINGFVVNEAWGLSSRKGNICLRNQGPAVEFKDVHLKRYLTEPEAESALLSGRWKAVSQQIRGNSWSRSAVDAHKKSVEFNGNQFEIRYRHNSKEVVEIGVYRLNPTWIPAWIDMSGQSPNASPIEFSGIYQFSDEFFKHAFVKTHEAPTRTRPDKFSGKTEELTFSTSYVRDTNHKLVLPTFVGG
ncbi:MAG: protein kinase [Rubripirellula sp.]|nr:protein kinase [Rubripirellula sp.]